MRLTKIITAFALMIAAGGANAQSFFVEVDAGYGFSNASQEIDYNSVTNDNGTTTSWSDELIAGSFGKGINMGLNLGYMFNENFGAGLNMNYLMGATYEFSYSYTAVGYNSSTTGTYKANMTRIMPSLIVQGSGEIAPYARLGIVLGMGSKVVYDEDYSNSNGDTEKYIYEVNEGLAMGTSAEVGVNVKFSENLSFIACLRGVNMNWSPNHGVLTTYNVNGIDVLPLLTTRDKEAVYLDEVSGTSPSTPNESQPDEQLRFYLPFSSIGFNIGVRYTL